MNIQRAFPSKFMKAADLDGGEFKVAISKVALVDVGDGEKPVLYFSGSEKGLVLNKTNASELALAFGNETDVWARKEVILYSMRVSFQGRTVDGIRIRTPPSTSAKSAPGPQDGDMDVDRSTETTDPSAPDESEEDLGLPF